ncbi:hypothetical protein [Pseudonocardia sp. HH130630-07]|uniref:hypothetical protein n=1 Tax=Pseudonocardia sp. HH130630-07 TaxID=1690815 RepID=UPI000814DC6C|nr:hypothetical protein [Pseudonocardia sp. HH130630-07]ANY09513.1 hypothetical protein AFB00_28400 [Pseudonocardia sp. HH130630-07]
MRIRPWAVATAVLALAAVASCSGPAATADPRTELAGQVEQARSAGSVLFDTRYESPQTPPLAFTGGLAWADGLTGEISGSGMTVRITRDALYSPLPQGLPAMGPLAGKSWIEQSFADLEQQFGPLGTTFRAAFERTDPIRSAALLVQAGDLRVVGEEDRGGVPTTHYAGTLRFHEAVVDLRLGLDQATLDGLRAQYPGDDSQTLDLWVDSDGKPVRAENRAPDGTVISADYRDYGAPVSVTAPPADEVVGADQLRSAFGLPGN